MTNETYSKNDSLTIPLRIVGSGQPCPSVQIDNYEYSYWTDENVYFSGNGSVDDRTITNYTWDLATTHMPILPLHHTAMLRPEPI